MEFTRLPAGDLRSDLESHFWYLCAWLNIPSDLAARFADEAMLTLEPVLDYLRHHAYDGEAVQTKVLEWIGRE